MVNLPKIKQCLSDFSFCKALVQSERSSLSLRPLSMLPPKILRLSSPHSTGLLASVGGRDHSFLRYMLMTRKLLALTQTSVLSFRLIFSTSD